MMSLVCERWRPPAGKAVFLLIFAAGLALAASSFALSAWSAMQPSAPVCQAVRP